MRLDTRRIIRAELERQLSAAELAFARSTRGLIPGQKAVYECKLGGITFFLEIIFRDDEFTADLAWSHDGTYPRLNFEPYTPDTISRSAAVVRISFIWSQRDEWWALRPPAPPSIRSRAEIVRGFRGATSEVAAAQAPRLVADFIQKLSQHVVPVIRAVAAQQGRRGESDISKTDRLE